MAGTHDSELLKASRHGDTTAFAEIVDRYKSLVCAITYSATGSVSESEDVAQETFARAWTRMRSLRDPSKLRPWLCSIARNLVRSRHRRERRQPTQGAEPVDGNLSLEAQGPSPRERAISREEESIVWRALEAMPDGYREPLVLFYREEQSVAEVALLLDLSEDTVRQRLSRGRSMLRDQVAETVEGALRRSRPGKGFTAAVLAALSIPAAKTASSAVAVGAAAKAVKGAAAAVGAGVSGGFLGSLAGFLGAFWGIREDYRRAGTPAEKRLVLRASGLLLAWLALLGAVLAATPRLVGWRGLTSWDLIGGWIGLLIGGLCWWGSWYQRKRRRIQPTSEATGFPQSDAVVLVEGDWRTRGAGGSAPSPYRTALLIVISIAVFAALMAAWLALEFGLIDPAVLTMPGAGRPIPPVVGALSLTAAAFVLFGIIVLARADRGYRKILAASLGVIGAYVIGHLWLIYATDLPSRWGAVYTALYGAGLIALIVLFHRKVRGKMEKRAAVKTGEARPAEAGRPVVRVSRGKAYLTFYLIGAGSVSWMAVIASMTNDWVSLVFVASAAAVIPLVAIRAAEPVAWRILFTELLAVAAVTLAAVNIRWTAWMEEYRRSLFYQEINDIPLWVLDLLLAAVFAVLLTWIGRESRRQQRLFQALPREKGDR